MDPTILNPATRFARPDYRTSRSPSRSPTRRQQFINHELDPLLADLSPSSTLEALQSTDAVLEEVGTHKRALLESVADVSTSDRGWGIKAALAGKKVKEWLEELGAWPWPTTSNSGRSGFEPPPAEPDIKLNGASSQRDENEKQLDRQFWGSLRAEQVQEYEDRIEDIKDDMEALELEELKEHVRASHRLSTSKRSIYGQTQSDDDQRTHLDNFTAIITATIMQTLPTISRLNSLLGIWSTRLLVLRQVPGYLECLGKTQVAMRSAWDVTETPRTEDKQNVDDQTFSTIRSFLEKQISELGQRLDCMLDALEGREDTIPDHWIDDMESLEADFGSWVVMAERQVLRNGFTTVQLKHEDQASGSSAELQFQSLSTTDDVQQSPLSPERESTASIQTHPYPSSDDVLVLDDYLQSPDLRPPKEWSTITTPELSRRSRSLDYFDRPLRKESNGLQYKPSKPMDLQSDSTGELTAQLDRLLASRPFPPSEPSVTSRPITPNSPAEHQGAASGSNLLENFKELETAREPSTMHAGEIMRGRSTSRPVPLILKKSRESIASNAASDPLNVSYPGSSTSDYFSDMSSPEIQQASRAEYFGAPVEVITPLYNQADPMSQTDTVSRQSSQRTERGSRSRSLDLSAVGAMTPTGPRSRASSFIPESTIPENGALEDPWATDRNGDASHARTRSASMQSIEVVPRNEVRNVTVSRKSSYSAAPKTPPQNPNMNGDPHKNLGDSKDQKSNESQSRYFFYAPTQQTPSPFSWAKYGVNCDYLSESRSNIKSSEEHERTKNDVHPPLPLSQPANTPTLETTPPPPPSKPRNRFEDVADLPAGSTPVKIRQRRKSDTSPHKVESRGSTPAKNDAERLEARINSILTEIPAHIRLTSGPEPDATDIKQSPSDLKNLLPRSNTTPRLSRAATTNPVPAMTLTRAGTKSIKSRSSNVEPEIKLYHLHQSGKDVPIKLFVRLVGEGGERVMVRIGGGWADLGEYLKEYASHHGKRSVSDSRFAIQELPSSPVTSSPAISSGSAPNSRPSSSHTYAQPVTPEVIKSFEGRPGSAHSFKDEDSPLGGGGPKSKKVNVSPSKQAWVDGMLEQARNGAMEKGQLGDLGKFGGTKRVFLRAKTTQ